MNISSALEPCSHRSWCYAKSIWHVTGYVRRSRSHQLVAKRLGDGFW